MLAELYMVDRIPEKVENLIGIKFGNGCVVIGYAGVKQYTNSSLYYWWALCDCGNEFKIQRSYIFGSYKRKMCPQCSRKNMGLNNRISMIGKRFGRWIVLEEAPRMNRNSIQYFCRCDCGTEKSVNGPILRNGISKSCGCLQREIAQNQIGDKNPNWNPNLTNKERQRRRNARKGFITDSKLKLWRTNVFERDHYICKCCGTKKSPFNAHHLNAWHTFPDQRYIIANGVTLCVECHKLFHKQYGSGYNTKEQYQEFFLLCYNG